MSPEAYAFEKGLKKAWWLSMIIIVAHAVVILSLESRVSELENKMEEKNERQHE